MIEAKIVADSISPNGVRLTSFQLKMHRFILSEFNTHRMFSRSSSSSRAIPIKKMLQNVIKNPAYPVFWGKNKNGMQAKEELLGIKLSLSKFVWRLASYAAVTFAYIMYNLGLHKQIGNRILEPWMWTNTIVTATEWDNFFLLRNHCYSDDTEVLTKNGWKLIKDIKIGEMVYTLNPKTQYVEYSDVVDKTLFKNNKNNVVNIKSKNIDLILTMNHKQPIIKNNKIKLVYAEELLNKTNKFIKGNFPVKFDFKKIKLDSFFYEQHNQYGKIKDVEIRGYDVNTTDLMYFIGFYLGNGYKSTKRGNYIITLCKGGDNKDIIINKLKNVIERLTKNSINQYDRNGVTNIYISDAILYQVIKNVGNKAIDKKIPEFVWELGYDNLYELYCGLMDSDSNWLSQKHGFKFSTSSKNLADDVQRLCMLIGKVATISTIDRRGVVSSGIDSCGNTYNIMTKHINYSVSITNRVIQQVNKKCIFVNEYDGNMCCITTRENHIIFVRRNGKSIWSGNSDAQPEIRELAIQMQELYDNSHPSFVNYGEWHLPYIVDNEKEIYPIEDLIKMSVARCARVSYNKHDGNNTTKEEDIKLHDRLLLSFPPHASPAEHQATPIRSKLFSKNLFGWEQYRWEIESHWENAKEDFVIY